MQSFCPSLSYFAGLFILFDGYDDTAELSWFLNRPKLTQDFSHAHLVLPDKKLLSEDDSVHKEAANLTSVHAFISMIAGFIEMLVSKA